MPQNWRGNVVGQISINANAFARKFPQIKLQNIPGNNLDVSPSRRSLGEALCQLRVRLNCCDARSSPSQEFGHLAVPGTNLDPVLAASDVQRLQDSFPPS